MKLLHTADWHLGRVYHQTSLLDDQAHVLAQLVDLVRIEAPDAVLVAGDVYDRSVPPASAVRLLDETLTRIVRDLGVPVVMIAGNHDSADRLGFGADLLAAHGLTIRATPTAGTAPVVLTDAHGEVAIYPVPYADLAQYREIFGDEGIASHQDGMAAVLAAIRAQHPAHRRAILLAHAFVAGGAESESERALSVGGSGAIHPSIFDGFDYVALGHLHRPQNVGGPGVQYAGSLLKYSFSEVDHAKSAAIVTLDADGAVTVERRPLQPRRDLRILEGDLAALVAAGKRDPGREDYVLARLTDEGALLEPMARLREAYPNALAIERVVFGLGHGPQARTPDHRRATTHALFESFWQELTDGPLSDAERPVLAAIITAIEAAEREATGREVPI